MIKNHLNVNYNRSTVSSEYISEIHGRNADVYLSIFICKHGTAFLEVYAVSLLQASKKALLVTEGTQTGYQQGIFCQNDNIAYN